MPNYRRWFVPGGSYFFTVVSENRAPIFCTDVARPILSEWIQSCQRQWPFRIDAMVLLPDHLHTIWTLPPTDTRYPARWGWIKKEFTKAWLAVGGVEQARTASRRRNRRRGVWQRRYWEHTLEDADDFERHFDYIHFNPVKHRLVKPVRDWPYSSFHRWVKQGAYSAEWGGDPEAPEFRFDDLDIAAME
jgi:REP-associated tyrosine transposase